MAMTTATIYGFKVPGDERLYIYTSAEDRDKYLPSGAVPFDSDIEVPEVRKATPMNMSEVIVGLVDSVGWRTLMWTGMGWTGMDRDGNNRTWADSKILDWKEFRVGMSAPELVESMSGRMDVQELGKLIDPLAWDEEAYQDYTERTRLQIKAMGTARDVIQTFLGQVAPND